VKELRRSLTALLNEGPGTAGIPFDHGDPMDPNDRVRQKTQSRAGNYPYDTPVMYGRSTNTDANGSSYMDGADQGPPLGREAEPDQQQPMTVWDRMSDMTDHLDPDLANVEIGPTGQNAASYGYGRNGLREIDDEVAEIVGQSIGAGSMCWDSPEDAGTFDSSSASDLVDDTVAGIMDLVSRMDRELASTQDDFRSSYRNPRPMKKPKLGLLSLLGTEESPEDVGNDEVLGIYDDLDHTGDEQ